MDNSVPFSVLNERLRPRFTAMERLCYSLNTLEDKQQGSLRTSPSTARPTILPAEPEPKEPVSPTSVEPEDDVEREDPVSDGFLSQADYGDGLLAMINQCLDATMNIDDLAAVRENETPSPTEQTGNPDGLTTERTGEESEPAVKEEGSESRRSYLDRTLPDLIRSGRPLSRRRTLGPVSDTVR